MKLCAGWQAWQGQSFCKWRPFMRLPPGARLTSPDLSTLALSFPLKWGARTIDIDMLVAEGAELDTEELHLPHPYLFERAFVLVPLADIAAELPVRGRAVREWLAMLPRAGQEASLAAEIAEPFPLKLIACIDEERGLGREGKFQGPNHGGHPYHGQEDYGVPARAFAREGEFGALPFAGGAGDSEALSGL